MSNDPRQNAYVQDLEKEYDKIEKERDQLREALDWLYAEVEVGMKTCIGVVFKGLEEGVATVPNSLPHGSMKFHLPRIEKRLEMARIALGHPPRQA